MIACLRGLLIHRDVNRVIVDVNGVGYNVFVSLNTLGLLPESEGAKHLLTGDLFLLTLKMRFHIQIRTYI